MSCQKNVKKPRKRCPSFHFLYFEIANEHLLPCFVRFLELWYRRRETSGMPTMHVNKSIMYTFVKADSIHLYTYTSISVNMI